MHDGIKLFAKPNMHANTCEYEYAYWKLVCAFFMNKYVHACPSMCTLGFGQVCA